MARPEVTGKRIDESPPPISGSPPKKKKQKKVVTLEPLALAFSVDQFCKIHNISIGFFYELLKAGLGPKIMKLGARTLISAEAAAQWRAERTVASESNVTT
jgi:hypothetical protein